MYQLNIIKDVTTKRTSHKNNGKILSVNFNLTVADR